MKLITSIFTASVFSLILSPSFAKTVYPAEIVGRDLNQWPLGWLGHVGIATAPMNSPIGMLQEANLVIEILNEAVVGQINSLSNFKSRSAYWGSRYGLADRGERGYRVLLEANHQRWWCPTYTTSTSYVIGAGIPITGQALICGVWRCDTYAWWAFYSAGYDAVPGRIMTPRNVFFGFPFANISPPSNSENQIPKPVENGMLSEFNSNQLNTMSFEQFSHLADIPLDTETPDHLQAEMSLVLNENLESAKRSLLIDRLVIGGKYPNLVSKLLDLYTTTVNIDVQKEIIKGLMIYYQNHLDLTQLTTEQQLLSEFYQRRLFGNWHNQAADHIVRSYVDVHNSEEIIANKNMINTILEKVPHQSSIMLKMNLINKSKPLEEIYLSSLLSELTKANSPDLDSYFFGPLTLAFKHNGAQYLLPKSKKMVIGYLNQVKSKYTSLTLKQKSQDPIVALTASIYDELIQAMN